MGIVLGLGWDLWVSIGLGRDAESSVGSALGLAACTPREKCTDEDGGV
jgi:hypothetical protein